MNAGVRFRQQHSYPRVPLIKAGKSSERLTVRGPEVRLLFMQSDTLNGRTEAQRTAQTFVVRTALIKRIVQSADIGIFIQCEGGKLYRIRTVMENAIHYYGCPSWVCVGAAEPNKRTNDDDENEKLARIVSHARNYATWTWSEE